MCSAGAAFALAGRIACRDDDDAIRLPPDVCTLIVSLTRPRVWQQCRECGATLLELHRSTPFVAHTPTSWRYDGHRWLLTDRGSLHTAVHARTRAVGDDDPHVLRLRGTDGRVVPGATPTAILLCVGDDDYLRFDNCLTTIAQREWFKVVAGRHLCRSCLLQVRRRRVWFAAWRGGEAP